MPDLSLTIFAETYSVCRLTRTDPIAPVPGAVSWVVAAPDEITLVCPSDRVPVAVEREDGWRCLRIEQTFAFDVPGILAAVLQPLAAAGIGICATSTFSTDYVLVRAERLNDAVSALESAGHRIHKS